MAIVQLELEKIRIDGGTQQRAAIEQEHVDDIAEAISDGIELPPVRVYEDAANRWLSRGFHRYHAHRKAGKFKIRAELVKGTLRDAILDSVSDNIEHNALKRKNADKRNAVGKLLDDEEWRGWSDRNIAERCAVSARLVAELRKVHTADIRSQDSAKTPKSRSYTHPKTGKPAKMNVSRIGNPPDVSFFDDEPPKPTKDAKPKNGSNGHNPKTETESAMLDKAGNQIMRAEHLKIFARREEILEQMLQVSNIKTSAEKGAKAGDKLYTFLNLTQFIADCNSVRGYLKTLLAHALCPTHPDDDLARKDCLWCKGTGWLPEENFKRAEASVLPLTRTREKSK